MTENNRHHRDTNGTNDKMQPKDVKTSQKPKTKFATGKINYDIPQIKDFLNTVFHSPLEHDEHIIGWTSNTNTPSFPLDMDKVVDKLEKTGLPKACYFGTATVSKHDDGKVYNRKALFKRLHVVVLDDIGTKIKESVLPLDLAPNYIIESSEGNTQWGFILDTPIEDYDLAEALIHLVYTSGYCDEGGKMPTKVVRMPCGINGKKGDKKDFGVNLKELNNDYWTPSELIDVLDVGVSWDDVVKDINAAKHGKSSRFTGTSLWSPIRPTAASLSGVIDPVLEWLYENDMVSNDNGEWIDIECPWHEGHSDGNKTAGYSPIGRGGEMSNRRSFHCFHGHCADNNTPEFLQKVAELSGIQAPMVDNVADLVADYAYVASEDSAYRVRGVNKPTGMKINAFKNVHARKVAVYDHAGREKMIAEHALWLASPNRLIVQGIVTDPSSSERVVEHDGLRYLNNYASPQWGKGSYDQGDVDTFKRFMKYLVPNETERDYFMQWLSAKAQNPTFKGAAVLMVAPSQGTGRTTLTDMITTLFTSNNVKKVTFPQLCGATEAGAFNDFMDAGIVTCDEIMSHSQNKHKVYESLKDLFDPRPKSMVINKKYGGQTSMTVYTSYLLLTNHMDAIGQLGEDRRVYVIQNTLNPKKHDYFVELNKWLDKGTWARNVWRWLQTLEPDIEMLHAPAPRTTAKDAMIDATKSTPDILAKAVLTVLKGVFPTNIQTISQEVLEMLNDKDADKLSHVVASILKSKSQATSVRSYVDGKQIRFRVSNDYLRSLGINDFSDVVKERAEISIKTITDEVALKLTDGYEELLKDISDTLDDLMV